MNVFVAGASGILGRLTIAQLIARGHQVVGLVRSREKEVIVASLGAAPAQGDLLNAAALRPLVVAAEPDAVLHLATAIPTQPKTTLDDFAMNDRLRREGTANLIEACRGLHLASYVQQSIAFVYGDLGGTWITEEEPPRPDGVSQSAIDGEELALAAYREWGLPATILRGASFYHYDAWSTRTMLGALRKRRLPIIGNGQGYWHLIHVEDMAAAVVAAIEQGDRAAGEIFFVADDYPSEAQEILRFVAREIGAKPPRRVPRWLARLAIGPLGLKYLTQSARYHNAKIKETLGWAPAYPIYKDGFTEIVHKLLG